MHGQFLVFQLEGQRYAIPLAQAREVVRAVAITPLPGAPAVVEGVIDVRGAAVPVFDVRSRFGLAARPLDPAQQLVLAWTGTRTVALRVDRAHDIVELEDRQVDDPSELARGVEHLVGVARLPDGMILIHDLGRFLSQAEHDTLVAALAASGGGA